MHRSCNRSSGILHRAWYSTKISPTIRVATTADIDAIVDLTYTTLRDAKMLKGDRTSAFHVASLLDKSQGGVIVAEVDNEIVGSIFVEKPDKMYALTMRKDWREQDIGSQLFRRAEVYAKQMLGMAKVQGPVLTTRTDLFEFYERLGSIRTGIIFDHPEGGGLQAEIVMKVL
ncbi:hypothetical protein Ae201684P_018285 [Aphanomyces euteiches]|uniref:N-acetyltransferase domain-containing protein n=1 Tax=Aphanomyces euteiches TaxID=100861 RepID=A0A6G0WFY9_9STRA|nr:hypothetical protein Ae201684_015769 [Aphanomyces euteiches]KAH9099268.1 hypothetical protein Ae201684P_018285 [Aphanomyces euteiches]KAH9138423.1 hypothetical protein AeRB84_017261 [Aphanomyces euteiches]